MKEKSNSYKNTVCSTVSSSVSVRECIANGEVVSNKSNTDYVGLLRVGEMFASKNRSTYSSSSNMWLITPYSSYKVSYVDDYGRLGSDYAYTNPSGARPTINLKSEIVIKSGSGTKQDPFVVGLPN